MKVYKTLKDAAEKYNVEPEKLQEMIGQGDVHTVLFEDELLVSEDDVRTYVAKRDVSREQFKHLEGVEIGLNQAAIKYGFSTVVLSDWMKRGQVRFIRRQGNRKIINEADVAYARALADMKGLRSGRPLFDRRSRKKKG